MSTRRVFGSVLACALATPAWGAKLVEYKFDGNANDSSGNGLNLALAGNATYGVGRFGSALQLDGSGDYAFADLPNTFTYTNFTIECWAAVPDWSPNVHYVSLYDVSYLVLGHWGNPVIDTWADGLSPIAIPSTGQTAPTTLAWHHLALTYDGAAQRFYVDGTLVSTTATTGAVTQNPASFNMGLVIGARYDKSTQFVNGRLDNVRIWNQALPASQLGYFTDGGACTDADADGYTASSCGGADCNDNNAAIRPGATETCNLVDDNCNGSTDEGVTITYYQDADADKQGTPSVTKAACSAPAGYVADKRDCNDNNAKVGTGFPEYCDLLDNDCDGTVDGPVQPLDGTTYYQDFDKDTQGNASVTKVACSAPAGYVADKRDCNDNNAKVGTGFSEYCDTLDNDCDGTVDGPATPVDGTDYYADADNDGHGTPSSSKRACAQPAGYATSQDDCDDTRAFVYTGATEVCDGFDDDCDNAVDEDAVDAGTWYPDADGDSYGVDATAYAACAPIGDDASVGGDCDDTNADANPDGVEIAYDGIDQDCSGADLCDDDGDGGTALACDGDDCDDADPNSYAGAEEVWYDGIDEACDGGDDDDRDGDGHGSALHGGDDCDDADETVYPGAPDEPYDGVISDCDEADEYDADGDGHDRDTDGGDDCDDAASDVHPDAEEVTGDGVDQDCSGGDTCLADGDNDGQADLAGGLVVSDDLDCTDPGELPINGEAIDCADDDPAVFRGAVELCGDGIDQNCDGEDEACTDGDAGGGGCSCDVSGGATPAWAALALALAWARRRTRG